MRKGFIFTVDALYALLLVLFSANLLMMFYWPSQSDSGMPELAEFRAGDAAQMGFLLHKSPEELGAGKPLTGDYACKAVLAGNESQGQETRAAVYCGGIE